LTVAILDIDGTLVDTNYQHVLAWYRAFRHHGIVLPVWRIHRHIGMGGDLMIEALTDEQTERERGDLIRESESERYRELLDEVETMASSRELIEELKHRGHTVILASSAKDWEVEHYVELLGARSLADGWTTSADVRVTKPHPDLVRAALECGGNAAPGDAVMVGDTPWDVRAADAAEVKTLAVLTGGFSRDELTEAGAMAVFESVAELCANLDETSLG
jgi:HAD superfamily hydrolase (TIGR01509 family)